MENLNGILDILKTCFWVGVIVVSAVLVVLGILRWLASSEKRSERLNSASWIAFIVLAVMIFYSQRTNIASLFASSDGSQALTFVLINGSKMISKLLVLGVVFVTAAIILLVFLILFMKGAGFALYIKSNGVAEGAKKFKEKSEQFGAVIKAPIFAFFVTYGILLMFIILPLFLEEPKHEAGLAETWIDGVQTFASAISRNADVEKSMAENGDENLTEDTDSKGAVSPGKNMYKTKDIAIPEAVITYILVYIVVIGVGSTIIRIIYAIVKDSLKRKQAKDLIGEYSGSMGVLGVGVAILMVLQDKKVNIYQDKLFDVILAFFKYFMIVVIVLALAITVLELISLVMDMREKLIRREAKYLFVALVGQVSLLILTALNSSFSALNNAIGQKHNEMDTSQIQPKLRRCITKTMEQEIEQRTDNGDVTFISFKESVTKK